MRNFIYLVVTVLLNAWIIGYIGYKVGGYIHILLFITLGAILFSVVQRRIARYLT